MEGNLPGGSMMDSPSYGVVEVQCSVDSHQPNQHSHPFRQPPQQQHQQGAGHHHPQPVHNLLSLTAAPNLDLQHSSPNFWTDPRSSSSGVKVCGSDEDEHSFNEDGVGGHADDDDKGKKGSPWHRMKWTDAMVKLLISIVAYIGEDVASEYNGGRKKLMILHKKGKWKSVSRVMAARGCYVSPQQCEDKFNDLNKRYKRLTDVLGRGTSCRVVENPVLLDAMDLSEKAKEDVRKILSSKHLFYEEMCSYHNGNRLHLLDDPSLFQCLQSVLRGRAGKDVNMSAGDDEDEEEDEDEGEDDGEEDDVHGEDGGLHYKRVKIQNSVAEGALWATPSNAQVELPEPLRGENMPLDVAEMPPPDQVWAQKEWIKGRMLQLQEQKMSIETQALELEAQHFKWQRFSRKKDRELDKLRLENERMKLLNERSLLELKRKELELGLVGRSDTSMSDDIAHCALDHWQPGDERNNI